MAIGRPRVIIRPVWAHNFTAEFYFITTLLTRYPYVAIDTEFPGTVFDSSKPYHQRTAEERYALVKKNVDNLHLIQLGFTLFDADGSLPGNGLVAFAWEFNFSDFDLLQHLYVPKSVSLLVDNGLDLLSTRVYGIPSCWFANTFARSTRMADFSSYGSWVTFHGAYDFAYLMKVITQRSLPETLEEYLTEVKRIFGRVYDIKNMTKFCNDVHGGLEQVARTLQVERVAGRSHNAGSDSVLTGMTFTRLVNLYFQNEESSHAGKLYGL